MQCQRWLSLHPAPQLPQPLAGCRRSPSHCRCCCRSNLAPYFSLWDDILGTGPIHSKGHWATPVVIAAHAAYMAAFFGGLALLTAYPLHTLAAYAVAYLLTPPSLAASLFNVLRIPEAVRYLAGGLMDRYRARANVTYAAPGTPGFFDVTCGGEGGPSTFIFACHPTGTACQVLNASAKQHTPRTPSGESASHHPHMCCCAPSLANQERTRL